MGLMKNRAVGNFGKEEKEPSIALGTILISRALPRPTPEIYVADNTSAWAYIVTNNGKITEHGEAGRFDNSNTARQLAVINALSAISLWHNANELEPVVVVYTKHKRLFNWIEQKQYQDIQFELTEILLETDDLDRGYYLDRVEYLLEHSNR